MAGYTGLVSIGAGSDVLKRELNQGPRTLLGDAQLYQCGKIGVKKPNGDANIITETVMIV